MPEGQKYINLIRTNQGDLPVNYDALYNKPESDTKLETAGAFADAQVVGSKINQLQGSINNLNSNSVSSNTTINGKKLTSNIELTPSDIKAAPEQHNHSVSDITSGVLSTDRGGTGAENGKDGLKNLLAAGHMILSENQYGNSIPPVPEKQEDRDAMKGRIFFVKVQQ